MRSNVSPLACLCVLKQPEQGFAGFQSVVRSRLSRVGGESWLEDPDTNLTKSQGGPAKNDEGGTYGRRVF